MTKLRKVLMGLALTAAVAVPVGTAYAAGDATTHPGPRAEMHSQSGRMGSRMDPDSCAQQHAAHQGQTHEHRAATHGMHGGMGGGTTTTSGS